MPQDAIGWIVVLAALALGFVLGRASGRGAAERDRLMAAPPAQASAKPSPETIAAVEAELAAGNFIAAIKLMREATGMDLKASKEAVERMAAGR
jgi:ribosomal protein L7/L12